MQALPVPRVMPEIAGANSLPCQLCMAMPMSACEMGALIETQHSTIQRHRGEIEELRTIQTQHSTIQRHRVEIEELRRIQQAGPKTPPTPALLEGRVGILPIDEEPRTLEKVFVNHAAVWGKRPASAEHETQVKCGTERDGAAVGSKHHRQESSSEKSALASVPFFLGDPPSSSLASFSRRKPLAERDQSAENARRAPTPALPGAQGPPRGRSWSEGERTSHKRACLGKRKLTLGQKLDIVSLHEAPYPERKSQVELASMFEKSKTTISKTLRPDSVAKLKASPFFSV